MRLLAAFAVLLLANLSGPAAPRNRSGSTESEIRQLHAQLIAGYMHNDAAILNRVLADNYTFIDEDGRFLTKPHIVESFRSGDHRVFSYDVSEERIRVYGKAAVLTCRYVSRQTYKGQKADGEYRLMRVFAIKNGHWEIVAGQETRISAGLPAEPSNQVDNHREHNAEQN